MFALEKPPPTPPTGFESVLTFLVPCLADALQQRREASTKGAAKGRKKLSYHFWTKSKIKTYISKTREYRAKVKIQKDKLPIRNYNKGQRKYVWKWLPSIEEQRILDEVCMSICTFASSGVHAFPAFRTRLCCSRHSCWFSRVFFSGGGREKGRGGKEQEIQEGRGTHAPGADCLVHLPGPDSDCLQKAEGEDGEDGEEGMEDEGGDGGDDEEEEAGGGGGGGGGGDYEEEEFMFPGMSSDEA